MKRYRISRVTKAAVWLVDLRYGAYPPRRISRRIPMETFRRDWVRLPQKEAMLKKDLPK